MACAFVRFGRRELLAVAAACLLVGPLAEPTSGKAASTDAEQVVQGLVEAIWTTLRDDGVDRKGRVDALTALLETRTDVALLSRLALGRYWNQLPDAQRQDYQELFREVVIRSLARRLDTYAEDAEARSRNAFRSWAAPRPARTTSWSAPRCFRAMASRFPWTGDCVRASPDR